jgi:S1-C subfamily serine protease
VVRSVGRGTLAERAGVRPGDVVLQLNGVTVPNAATFQQWMDNAPAGTQLNVLVGRDGDDGDGRCRGAPAALLRRRCEAAE